jgi:hypothetical protein
MLKDNMRRCLSVAFLAISLVGCGRKIAVIRNLISQGQGVYANNHAGAVAIFYISPITRKYAWDWQSRIVTMMPREEAFLGMTGLYNPAESMTTDNSTIRLVVMESKMYFTSYNDVYAFLKQSSEAMNWVYTNDGLVVDLHVTRNDIKSTYRFSKLKLTAESRYLC